MSTEISEYDIVEIVAANPHAPKAEVECVFPDGTNKWEGTFLPCQIKLVEKIQG